MSRTMGGFVASGGITLTTRASISFSASGDNTLVAGIASKIVRVYRIFLVVSAATNLTFVDGTPGGTNFDGALAMSANGGLTLDFSEEPWFVTSAGNAFVLNQSGSAQIGGCIYYQQS